MAIRALLWILVIGGKLSTAGGPITRLSRTKNCPPAVYFPPTRSHKERALGDRRDESTDLCSGRRPKKRKRAQV